MSIRMRMCVSRLETAMKRESSVYKSRRGDISDNIGLNFEMNVEISFFYTNIDSSMESSFLSPILDLTAMFIVNLKRELFLVYSKMIQMINTFS